MKHFGIVLLIGLLFVPGVFAQEKERGKKMSSGPEWAEGLDLTPEQESKIENLTSAHMKDQVMNRARLRVAKMELEQQLRKDTLDEKEIMKQVDEVNKLQAQLHTARIQHRMSMHALLSAEQRDAMQQMQREKRGERMHKRMMKGDNERNDQRGRYRNSADLPGDEEDLEFPEE